MVLFAGIKPGSRVMDMLPGQGYFTRIFAKVVGDKGYVYAFSAAELDPMIQKRFPGVDITKQFSALSQCHHAARAGERRFRAGVAGRGVDGAELSRPA
ncbi:MAG: hypothetical protein WDN08_21140 [Rhizomicrobium sp.]